MVQVSTKGTQGDLRTEPLFTDHAGGPGVMRGFHKYLHWGY